MSESTPDPSAPLRPESTEPSRESSSPNHHHPAAERTHQEEAEAREVGHAAQSSESTPQDAATTNAASADAPPAAKRKRRRRRKRSTAATDGQGPPPADAASPPHDNDASTALETHPTPKTKAAPPRAAPQKKKRSPSPRPVGTRGHDTRTVGPALDKLARWRWLPPRKALQAVHVEARSTVVETSAVETSAVETSAVETSAVETSSDGEFKSALESEGSSVGTAADAESSAADEPAPAVQLDATPTGDVYPETTVATSDAELPIEQDALSLTSTTPSTAERVSDENVDGETTLRQSADTPQADASGDTSASAIRTDEPRGTERHNTAFSLPSAEELPAWLESFTKVFEADEQPTMWTGLCSYPEFRASFQRLPEQQRQAAQPYLIAYQAVFLDTPPNIGGASTESDDARTLLHRALTQLLTASPAALKTWPVTARERMLDLAAGFEVPGVHSEASAALFPDAPRTNARIRLAQVCDSLARGHFAEAKTQLESLKQQSLAPSLLPVLHGALDGQRFGNVVILIYGGAGSRGSDPKAPKRHSGFCLESQRDVWIRVGEPHDAASFERHSQVYRRALIPGVVGLYTFGITRSRKPYLSVLRRGLSLDRRISHHWGLSRMAAVRLATEITLTASSLCRAGIRLPDMETRRFEIDQDERLWLSDLWGGETTEPKAQDATAVEQCRSCLLQLLQSQPGFELPRDWCDVLANAADFETLIATLRTLDRSRFWRE